MGLQERCRELRLHLGLSARGMSHELALSNNVWCHYESGNKEPSVSTLTRLHSLGVNVNWLLTGDGAMMRLGGPIATTQGADTGLIRLTDVIQRIREIFTHSEAKNLHLWAAIVEILARHSSGCTLAELNQLLSEEDMPRLEQNLNFLIAEGIVVQARGVFRLVALSLVHRTADYELQLLVAIRAMLEEILPAGKVDPRNAVLISVQTDAARGAGRELLRELTRVVKNWHRAQANQGPLDGSERVHLVLASALQPSPGD